MSKYLDNTSAKLKVQRKTYIPIFHQQVNEILADHQMQPLPAYIEELNTNMKLAYKRSEVEHPDMTNKMSKWDSVAGVSFTLADCI